MRTESGLSLTDTYSWLTTSAHWWGENGLAAHIREHLGYTVVAVTLAALIALPLGTFVGHTGRGIGVVGGITNALRAVPTLGFVVLLVVWLSPKITTNTAIPGFVQEGGLGYFIPVIIVLVVLAIPPILTNTYAGIQNVDPAVRDAARGMGMSDWQIVRSVELPCALPLVLSGLRSATLQVIATATVAAAAPFLGGLGRLIIDGVQQLNDPEAGYPAMISAGLVVAVLAVLADVLLIGLERTVVSPGLRTSRRSRRSS